MTKSLNPNIPGDEGSKSRAAEGAQKGGKRNVGSQKLPG